MATDSGPSWSAQAADLIHWFQHRRDEVLDAPFLLNAWTSVRIPARFYAALERDIGKAPRVPGRPDTWEI